MFYSYWPSIQPDHASEIHCVLLHSAPGNTNFNFQWRYQIFWSDLDEPLLSINGSGLYNLKENGSDIVRNSDGHIQIMIWIKIIILAILKSFVIWFECVFSKNCDDLIWFECERLMIWFQFKIILKSFDNF